MSGVLARAVVVLEGDSSELDKVMSAAEKRMQRAGEIASDIGGTLTTRVTLPLALFGAMAVKAFGEQEDAAAKVEAMLRATGNSAGTTGEAIASLAEHLEATANIEAETVQGAASMLMAFQGVQNVVGKGNDIFDRALTVSADMSTLMGGDMSGAAMQLGKALEDPATGLTMLRRAGITFTEQQQDQIKTLFESGRVLEAQKMILDAVEGKVKGLSEEMAKTPLGQMKQAWYQVGNAAKHVGAVLMEILLPVVNKVKEWALAFQNLDSSTKKTIVVIGLVAAAIGPLLVAIGSVMAAITGFSIVLGAAAIPVALAVAALGVLVVAGYQVVENWTWIKMQATAFWAFLKDAFFRGVDWILGKLQDLISGTGMVMGILGKLPGTFSVLGLLEEPAQKAANAVQGLRDQLQEAADESMAASGRALSELETELEKAGQAADAAGKKIQTAAKTPPAPSPMWLKPATDALKTFTKEMATAERMSRLLGSGFNLPEAEASALETAIKALVDAGVPFDAQLNKSGLTLGQMAAQLAGLRAQLTVKDAMTAMADAMGQASRAAAVLGEDFNLPAAQAAALETAIQSLTAAGVPMDATLNAQGVTLEQLGQRLADLRAQIKATEAGQREHDDAIARAKQAVEAVLTPQQQYQQTLAALNLALKEGKINQDEFNAAVKGAQKVLDDAVAKTDVLGNAIKDMTGRAMDNLVDMAFGAKVSFGDMIRSMLADITKLILKMEILKLLYPEGGGGGLGKLLGFADGGFLNAGRIGVVGERGPELISGGRNGVHITPLPAMAAAGGGGGGMSMSVQVNVNAIDSQDAARFFNQNEGLVAGAMLRAYQRSSALRSGLGR